MLARYYNRCRVINLFKFEQRISARKKMEEREKERERPDFNFFEIFSNFIKYILFKN